MKIITAAAALAALTLSMAAAGASQAAILTADFTADGATGGLGVASPYGEVTVNDAGGALAFTVNLFDGLRFRNTPDSNHFSFGFNLSGGVAAIGNIADNGVGTFNQVAGPVNQSPFGSFAYAIDCDSGCSTGFLLTSANQLTFTVTRAGGLTISDLVNNADGNLFAADVVSNASTGGTGNTGNVASTGLCVGDCVPTQHNGVPEPASWALMLIGFGGLGAALRSQRRRQALTAA